MPRQKKNKAQGDASLENAVYGLYARNDITHPDGKTGVIYKAGSQICTLTTDKEGKARIENLYLGEYYIKEITPSVGIWQTSMNMILYAVMKVI